MLKADADGKSGQRKPRRWLRWLAGVAGFGLVLVLLLVAYLWFQIREALPLLEGELDLSGLEAPVMIERDGYGVPSITAQNRPDAAYALGFLHAQDRFFQMDTLRRVAAGETAEVVGSFSLEFDFRQRRHHCRRTAEKVYALMPALPRAILDAYTRGVNAGLVNLGARPFEYWPLRKTPDPWKPEDSLLAAFAMYFNLQDSGDSELSRLLMQEALNPEAYTFLAENGSPWDAALDGSKLPIVPIPDRSAFPEIAQFKWYPKKHDMAAMSDVAVGSNAFAVSGIRSSNGAAIVANDMHLGYNVPNTWYRALWKYPDTQTKEEIRVTGMTLPGIPLLVTGTNGHVAWGFTNAYADTLDLVELELNPENENQYRTPEGYEAFIEREETFSLPGGETETKIYRDTRWGPVLEVMEDVETGRTRLFAIKWVAHQAEALNFEMVELEDAQDLSEAMDIANRSGIPIQNFIAGDSLGNAGWTLVGTMGNRIATVGTSYWKGILPPEEYPRIINPENALIWTANNRVVGGAWFELIGDGGYDRDTRAWQIRKRMEEKQTHTVESLLDIQLDAESYYLKRWQKLLIRTLEASDPGDKSRLREMLDIVRNWNNLADPDSTGCRLVNDFRFYLARRVLPRFFRTALEVTDSIRWGNSRYDQPLFMLANEKPAALVDPELGSWQAELEAAVEDQLDSYAEEHGEDFDLGKRTWNEANSAKVQHPLTFIVPFLNGWLSMPESPVPGANETPRVQAGRFGQSQRLIISPGREEDALFAMPGGQSGHPMSPFYKKGHATWANGEMLPLLPGETEYRLYLNPAN